MKEPQPGQGQPAPNPSRLRWNNSIRLRLAIGLVVLLLLLSAISMAIIWWRALPMLLEQRQELNDQIGTSLVQSLQQQFSQAEAISRAMARLAEALPHDDRLIRNTVPALLDNIEMGDLIAGGGLWPEPYRFHPADARHSFFWGRDPQGQLRFFDNYNDPTGPGYHQEEWYVPAKLQQNPASYWSRSYTDPYSRQPMVTCTTPFFYKGEFAGVSTLDLRLEGVHRLIEETFRNHSGYAFVLDRNNRFIAFPDMSLVLEESSGQSDTPNFITTQDLALHHPVFRPLADKLALLNHQSASRANQGGDEIKQLAADIAGNSYQIDPQEARIIAHNLRKERRRELDVLMHFTIQDDLLLRQPADIHIYQMPGTHWKVVTVFPLADLEQAARAITRTLSWMTIGGLMVWGLVLFGFMWRIFFRRLQFMTRQVQQAVEEDREVTLEHNVEDELGQFAYWYNLRTAQLHAALAKARQASDKLSDENREHQVTGNLLEKSLAMQKAVLDSANLVIISMDAQGLILGCNAGTTKLLGWRETDLVGKVFPHTLIDRNQLALYHDQLQQRFQIDARGFELFTAAAERGEKAEAEWKFTRQDGSVCAIQLAITPLLNPSHQLEGWLAVGSDITDRKRAEQQLRNAIAQAEQSSQAKSRFLANMSHEFRTPINTVLGFARRLQKKLQPLGNDRYLDALATIEHSAHDLLALVNDLLDVGRIETNRLELSRTRFNLAELVKEVYDQTHTLAAGRPINFGYQLPHAEVMIEADRERIQRVLQVLVENAFHSTEHGSVEILLSEPHHDGTVTLQVADTGKGISPEDHRKLLQRFSSLDFYMDERAGAGLGLYLAQQLVRLHRGNMTLDSAPGKGTRFHVTLPLHPPSA